MIRRIVASIVVGFLAALSYVGLPLVGGASPAEATPTASFQECLRGGWQGLTDAAGDSLPNQGACIAFVVLHPVTIADVASTSSFTGSTAFTFGPPCPFVFQIFDATYPGSAAVGSVVLHIVGCIDGNILSYSGSFTITTNVGTLTGPASGPIGQQVAPDGSVSLQFQLALVVSGATGEFAGSLGTLQFTASWDVTHAPPNFSGTVTAS